MKVIWDINMDNEIRELRQENNELKEEIKKLKAENKQLKYEVGSRVEGSKYELKCDLLDLESRMRKNIEEKYRKTKAAWDGLKPVCNMLQASGVTTITLKVEDILKAFQETPVD